MINNLIKNNRVALGISQQRLAELSGLSIATIQNIEAGKGNPTLEVIESLSKVLSFNLEFIPKKTNWNALCYYGLAMTVSNDESKNLKKQRSKQGLAELIISACFEIQNSKVFKDKERYKITLEALILALKNHYGKFFKENLILPIVSEFIPNEVSGKHLKHYRYSKDILGQYL